MRSLLEYGTQIWKAGIIPNPMGILWVTVIVGSHLGSLFPTQESVFSFLNSEVVSSVGLFLGHQVFQCLCLGKRLGL